MSIQMPSDAVSVSLSIDMPTIEMNAIAVHATVSVCRASRVGSNRYLSGHVLYFSSGYLSLQLDVQNFLSECGYGGRAISTDVFASQSNSQSTEFDELTQRMADPTNDPINLFAMLLNSTRKGVCRLLMTICFCFVVLQFLIAYGT